MWILRTNRQGPFGSVFYSYTADLRRKIPPPQVIIFQQRRTCLPEFLGALRQNSYGQGGLLSHRAELDRNTVKT